MYRCFVCKDVYAKCMPGADGDQRKHLESLELELNTAVSSNVGAGNQSCNLCKSNGFLTSEPLLQSQKVSF